jgi:hypothetical protein
VQTSIVAAQIEPPLGEASGEWLGEGEEVVAGLPLAPERS